MKSFALFLIKFVQSNLILPRMLTKNTTLFLLALLSCCAASAQTVTVKKENARIKNDYADGFQIDLAATYEEVEDALAKEIKTLGKSKENENYRVVSEPIVKGISYTQPVFAMTKQVGNIVSAWIGIKKDDWKEKEGDEVNRELEIMIHNFGVNFYRERIQKQIDESIRAQQAVDKQQQKLLNQNKDLNTKVENNKKEKIRLEQLLVDNKLEMESLIKRLEKNKKDQDSIAVASDQIKKMVEVHREKQRQVH
jgi:hypothetical protein